MKLENKIKSIILAIILLIMISCNTVHAAVNLSGTSGVQTILGMGSQTITNGGTYITLSLNDMTSSSNLYCMAYHNRNSKASVNYKVLTYIEIADGVATMWDVTGVKGRKSGYSTANKILAEILSGNYGATGYGSAVGVYTPTQKGLYSYMPTWIAQVGLSIGVDYSWTNTDFSDSAGVEVVNKAAAAVQKGANPTARIYLLDEWEGKGQAWQRLMIAQATSIPEEPEEDPKNPTYNGYIKIRGTVWEDGDVGKGDTINGIFGDGVDLGLGGIKVTLCDSNGNEFDKTSHTETNPDGTYEITVNLDKSPHVYKLYDEPTYVKEKIKDAYVKFEYNGYVYTTVAPYKTNINGKKTSRAEEDYGERSSFDSSNTTVGPETGIPRENNMYATTKNIINFENYSYKDTDEENPTIVYCYGQGKTKSYIDGDSTPQDRKYQLTNPDGEWLDVIYRDNQTAHNRKRHSHKESYDPKQYDRRYDPETGELIYEKEIFKDVFDYMSWCSGGHSIERTSITNLIIYDVNLGLFKREQPNIALTSDIQKVDVTMNQQKYTYIYGHKGNPAYDDGVFGTKVKFENKYKYTYRKPVNPADVGYVADANKEGILDISVTYKITLANQSNTLPVKVHKLWNCYDKEYTITSNTVESTVDKGKFKKSVVKLNNAVSIKPGETEQVYITYKVSLNAIIQLVKQDATLNNAFEIHTYSTQYGNNTLCAEQRTGSSAGRTGKAYAGRDINSSPTPTKNDIVYYESSQGRLSIKEEDWEDDTDIAPSFVLLLDTYKVMTGTVYEDTQTNKSKDNNERLGNGIKDSNEKGIANVKVELMRIKDNGEQELAKMYIIDRKNGKTIPVDAVTYTDENGNFWFGKDGSVGTKDTQGVVVDNYIIKYTYGNNDIKGDGSNISSTLNGQPISARNFKSTIVTDDIIKGVLSGTKDTKKWHLEINKSTNANTAVDDLELRANVTDNVPLIYSNFNAGVNMTAESIPVSIQVEYTAQQQANVNIQGSIEGGFVHTWETFDFGIIERPREDLIIDKTVSKLKLTLANGQVLIDGDPRVESLVYTKAIGVRNPSENAKERNGRDKTITIEMDSEYIQGATLETWYEVTATNNNEKDYDYSSNPKYYYYGDSKGLALIDTPIPYVVDYLDPEIICTIEEGSEEKAAVNTDWEIITADELKTNGYISEETYKKLKEENYLIFRTDAFSNGLPTGTSRSISLYASKLLANKDDKLEYENHTEIISINGKVARTINSVEGTKRVQNPKTYIPGDYTLLRKDHQQDDDMVKIVITPPTGLEDMIITYISIAAIALSVIGVGVYIIKKKILK